MSSEPSRFGAPDLALPAELRGPLKAHLNSLRERYQKRSWAGRVGFGQKPAVLVIDMAAFWLRPDAQIGSNLTPVLDAISQVLKVARQKKVPIFFTTWDYDPAHPPSPHDRKLKLELP